MNRFIYTKYLLCTVVALGLLKTSVFAQYVLPYPSFMPGHKLYHLSRVVDEIKGYWYWGNIAQVKYHLSLSGKYLVEAKTLLEYRQYLLGLDALSRSQKHFMLLPAYLARAEHEGKDVRYLKELVGEAVETHHRLLLEEKPKLPETFWWQPERKEATFLPLHQRLDEAVSQLVQVQNNL